MLAGNGQTGHTVALGLKAQVVGIVLAADGNRGVDLQIDNAGTCLCAISIVCLQAMLLEHLTGTLAGGSINLVVTY